MMNNICPKCGEKMSPFYLKQFCPKCGTDLLYYKLDERLEQDAKEADKQVQRLDHIADILKCSSVGSPIVMIRLILFFTPLLSMCLPFYSGLSLITVITNIIKGGFDIQTHLMILISMGLVIILSLAVIISSLFSATKTGLLRNLIFSTVNTAVFVILGVIIGSMGVGWYITLVIYIAEIALHIICNKKIKKSKAQ